MRFSGFNELLFYWGEHAPKAPAIRYAQNDAIKTCTYSELFDRVTKRAAFLSAEKKQAYGILSDGSFDCVIEIFSSVLSGRRTVLLDSFPVRRRRLSTPVLSHPSKRGQGYPAAHS